MRRLRQIEESKKLISEAFMKLLQDTPMDEISVSQIAQEAKIGRNTFYNHFQKKEDILDYLMHNIVQEFKDNLRQIENPTIKDILLWRFDLIKETPSLIVFHKQDDVRHLFFHFRDNMTSVFNFPAKDDEYKMEFYQGGLDYVTSKWIVNGMKESSEEMTEKVLSFMKR